MTKPKANKSKAPKPRTPESESLGLVAVPADIVYEFMQLLCDGKNEIIDSVFEKKAPAEINHQAKTLSENILSTMTRKLADDEKAKLVVRNLVDQFLSDYADFLDKAYLDEPTASLIEATPLNESRRKMAEQRRKMRKWVLKGEREITAEEWRKEEEKLIDLQFIYLRNVFGQVNIQYKLLEIVSTQSRKSKASKDPEDLLPIELVARQFLFEESPTKHTLAFISENFTAEQFRGFAKKLRALKKLNRVPIAPKKTNERRTVSKRELLNDIALRVKQYSKTFEALLSPDSNPWPRGILEMKFSSTEMELIISICDGFSSRTFEDAFKSFSYSELEDLSFKIDYRINAIVNDQACRNILTVKRYLYSENDCSDLKPPQSTRNTIHRELENCEVERKQLIKSLTKRILKPKIREMASFLIIPDVSDKMTCEEKLFIITCIRFQKQPDPCFISLEFLRRFAEKLTSFERKVERDLAEVMSDGELSSDNLICSPEDKRLRNFIKQAENSLFPEEDAFLFEKGQIANNWLVGLMYKIWRHKDYNFADPIQRIQFNKDFRTVFSNKSLVLNIEEKDVDCPEKIEDIYNKYINNVHRDETMDFVPYDKILLQLVERNMGEEEPRVIEILPEPALS